MPRLDKAVTPDAVADLLTKERRSSSDDVDIASDDIFLHVIEDEVGEKADTRDTKKETRAADTSVIFIGCIVRFDGRGRGSCLCFFM